MKTWLSFTSPAAALILILGLVLYPAPKLRADAYLVSEKNNVSAVDAAGVRHFERKSDPGHDKSPWEKDRLKLVAPGYPESERLQRHQGKIQVVLFLDLKTGTVIGSKVITSTGYPALDENFLSAARQCRWKPGRWREVPMSGNYVLVQDSHVAPPGAVRVPTAASPLRPNATKLPLSHETATYQKQVSDTIGPCWTRLMQAHAADLIEVGAIKIHFYIRPSGALEGIEVVLGKAKHPRLVAISMEALLTAKIPPMPKKVTAELPRPRGTMDVDFTFTNL